MSKTASRKPTKEEADEMKYEGNEDNVITHNYTDLNTGNDVSKKARLVQKTSSKIAPVKSNTYTGKAKVDPDGVGYQQEFTLPIYKAPTQRIEYDDSLQKTPVIQAKPQDPVVAKEKVKADASQRMPGYKRVASSDPKYKRFREYATYVKKEGVATEDPFKKATLEARKRLLQKNSAPKK